MLGKINFYFKILNINWDIIWQILCQFRETGNDDDYQNLNYTIK